MEKDKIIAELEAEVTQLKKEIERLKIVNEHYLEQLRLAQHRRFGASSEMTSPNQLSLFNEAEVIADAPEDDRITVHVRKKRKGKRKEFYGGLPTEQIVYELPENEQVCPDCGGVLHACGHEVLRREVEVIPVQVKAVEHVQTVYACRNCEQTSDSDSLPMVKSVVPAPVIAGSGIASPSLLSYIMSNKYVLALPLHRQEQELQRMGIHISRQTMANWVIYAANRWLKPIYDLLRGELLRGDILHADETTVQVIKEKGRTASQKSYMWMYHTGRDAAHQVALFEYQPTREGSHPQEFLAGYTGYLHVDAYSGYRGLEDQGVTLVECWAHARRKFDEALKALAAHERQNAKSHIGLRFCNRLFLLEREYDEMGLDNQKRTRYRELLSKPIAEEFFGWADSMIPNTLPKNKFGEAVRYAVNQKRYLMNFLLDGRLELSNNRAERTIRPFTVGRKNWLFSFCARGAKASAIVYSIIESAIANGLLPFAYLIFLFNTLPNIPPHRFHECLPWHPSVQQTCRIPMAPT